MRIYAVAVVVCVFLLGVQVANADPVTIFYGYNGQMFSDFQPNNLQNPFVGGSFVAAVDLVIPGLNQGFFTGPAEFWALGIRIGGMNTEFGQGTIGCADNPTCTVIANSFTVDTNPHSFQITSWDLAVQYTEGGPLISLQMTSNGDSASVDGDSAGNSVPGTWTVVATSIPEPNSLVLLSCGLAGLSWIGLRMRR